MLESLLLNSREKLPLQQQNNSNFEGDVDRLDFLLLADDEKRTVIA